MAQRITDLIHPISRRNLLRLGVTLAMVGAAWSCAGDAPTAESSIEPSELADRISAEAAPFILDVRTAEEFASGHIPGAVNVPHTELADRLSTLELPLGGEIVVHCEGGGRAGEAESILRRIQKKGDTFISWPLQ